MCKWTLPIETEVNDDLHELAAAINYDSCAVNIPCGRPNSSGEFFG